MAGIKKGRSIRQYSGKIAKITGAKPRQVRAILIAAQQIIIKELEQQQPITLPGFGTFTLIHHKGRGIKHFNGTYYAGYPHYTPRFEPLPTAKIHFRKLSKDPSSVLYCQTQVTDTQ